MTRGYTPSTQVLSALWRNRGKLSSADLERIRAKVEDMLREAALREEEARSAAEVAAAGAVQGGYRQEYVRCGKPGCLTCTAGVGHGPYWYRYQRIDGRVVKSYVGKQLPEGVAPR